MSSPSAPTVRALRAADLDGIVRIDARITGRPRPGYLQAKLDRALREGMQMSLGADVDGHLVGFLMGSVYRGEFGQTEPTATIDTVGVHPDFWRHGVGRALWSQFATNLRGLSITRIQTQVDWKDWTLLRFLERVGFAPAPRLCLERALDAQEAPSEE